jgi:hypothetical protein
MRVAVALVCVMLTGCFGYNPSAKKWSYVGDTLLIAGGGAAIALDVTGGSEKMCPDTSCSNYTPPISGGLVAGVVLVAAGVFGIVFNATRPNLKLSR